MEYVKDRTECFDDYYPCFKKEDYCNLSHVYHWIRLFVSMHNLIIKSNIKFNEVGLSAGGEQTT